MVSISKYRIVGTAAVRRSATLPRVENKDSVDCHGSRKTHTAHGASVGLCESAHVSSLCAHPGAVVFLLGLPGDLNIHGRVRLYEQTGLVRAPPKQCDPCRPHGGGLLCLLVTRAVVLLGLARQPCSPAPSWSFWRHTPDPPRPRPRHPPRRRPVGQGQWPCRGGCLFVAPVRGQLEAQRASRSAVPLREYLLRRELYVDVLLRRSST